MSFTADSADEIIKKRRMAQYKGSFNRDPFLFTINIKYIEFYPMRFKQFKNTKPEQVNEEDLLEITMSPSNLRRLAANINARAGVEFEMIVPNVQNDDDGDMEPDWDRDESTDSFRNIENFFDDGDFNSRRSVADVIDRLQEEFYEWLDETVDEKWREESFDYMLGWVQRNVSDRDVAELLGLAPDSEGNFDIGKSDYVKFVERSIEEDNSYYEDARDEFIDEERSDADEEEWLSDAYPSMSDIANSFGQVTWPHYYNVSSGEADIETVGSDFKKIIGKPVKTSSGYHGAKRNDTDYIVEPDSSLDPDDSSDAGLEFISPPMSVEEMFSDMDKIVKWAGEYGCYTNESTGLHMNISVPDMSTAKLDFIKLALLMGDEYILEQFGRSANTYAKSAMKIVRDRVSQRPEDAEKMLEQMKERLGALATKVIHSGETSKYTSINTKDGYVEFRSPGGDWLQSYSDDKGKIENTMLRFVVALDAAMDPEKYRKEYLTKLYKLLAPRGENDTLAYFAKFSAGELPQSELKSFVKQAQLERNVKAGKTAGQELRWEVGRIGYGASIIVVAKSKEEAIDKALAPNGYPDWANARNQLTVKPLGPAKSQSGETGTGNWGIWITSADRFARAPGQLDNSVLRRFPSRAAAEQWLESTRAENPNMRTDIEVREIEPTVSQSSTQQSRYELYRISDGRSIENQGQPIQFLATGPDDAESKIARYAADFNLGAPELFAVRSVLNAPRNASASGAFTGEWKIVDPTGQEIHRFGGVGNVQSDANRVALRWLQQNPRYIQNGVEVLPVMSE